MTVVNTAPPTISGTTVQGSALHATSGTWTYDNAPISYAYQWERCDAGGANCVDISSATASSYILAAADVGHTLRVRVTATESGPLPTPLPFAEADLRPGYVTYTPAATDTTVTVPSGQDALIDMQNFLHPQAFFVFGAGDSRIKVINGYWNITSTSPGTYRQGGPRIRSSDGVGPAHVSLTDMFVTGTQTRDYCAIDAGTNTKVTFQRCLFESIKLVTGSDLSLPGGEHCDAIQVQGKIGSLEVGLSTMWAQGVTGTDGGKCFMLSSTAVGTGPYTVDIESVNMRARGTTGTLLFQDERNITVNLTDVWAYKEDSSGFTWSSGSGMFYPNSSLGGTYSWFSTGSAPNRTADWPDAAAIFGTISEGLPADGDFITRAMLGH